MTQQGQFRMKKLFLDSDSSSDSEDVQSEMNNGSSNTGSLMELSIKSSECSAKSASGTTQSDSELALQCTACSETKGVGEFWWCGECAVGICSHCVLVSSDHRKHSSFVEIQKSEACLRSVYSHLRLESERNHADLRIFFLAVAEEVWDESKEPHTQLAARFPQLVRAAPASRSPTITSPSVLGLASAYLQRPLLNHGGELVQALRSGEASTAKWGGWVARELGGGPDGGARFERAEEAIPVEEEPDVKSVQAQSLNCLPVRNAKERLFIFGGEGNWDAVQSAYPPKAEKTPATSAGVPMPVVKPGGVCVRFDHDHYCVPSAAQGIFLYNPGAPQSIVIRYSSKKKSIGCVEVLGRSDLPSEPRFGAVGVELGSDLLLLGGQTKAAGVTGRVEILRDASFNNWKWVAAAPMATARRDFAAAVFGGCVFVVGGLGRRMEVLCSAELRSADGEWKAAPPLPAPRHSLAAAVFKGSLVVAGGCASEDEDAPREATVWRLVEGGWKALPPLRIPRASFGLVVLEGRLYAVGGEGPVDVGRSVEMFREAANVWEVLPQRLNFPAARSYFAVI